MLLSTCYTRRPSRRSCCCCCRATAAAIQLVIRLDLRLPVRSLGSSKQSNEHSALESKLLYRSQPPCSALRIFFFVVPIYLTYFWKSTGLCLPGLLCGQVTVQTSQPETSGSFRDFWLTLLVDLTSQPEVTGNPSGSTPGQRAEQLLAWSPPRQPETFADSGS
jgi:hypothetical protein